MTRDANELARRFPYQEVVVRLRRGTPRRTRDSLINEEEPQEQLARHMATVGWQLWSTQIDVVKSLAQGGAEVLLVGWDLPTLDGEEQRVRPTEPSSGIPEVYLRRPQSTARLFLAECASMYRLSNAGSMSAGAALERSLYDRPHRAQYVRNIDSALNALAAVRWLVTMEDRSDSERVGLEVFFSQERAGRVPRRPSPTISWSVYFGVVLGPVIRRAVSLGRSPENLREFEFPGWPEQFPYQWVDSFVEEGATRLRELGALQQRT